MLTPYVMILDFMLILHLVIVNITALMPVFGQYEQNGVNGRLPWPFVQTQILQLVNQTFIYGQWNHIRALQNNPPQQLQLHFQFRYTRVAPVPNCQEVITVKVFNLFNNQGYLNFNANAVQILFLVEY